RHGVPCEAASGMEGTLMEAVKILEKKDRVDWDYDEEADVLYLSIGKPRKAVGVDIGNGVVVRYDEKKREVVGLTILGVRSRLVESLEKD
ncbi:MAG: DUF2283 domain-containing protein, partial [Candidatus Methylomirabilales bacterium]